MLHKQVAFFFESLIFIKSLCTLFPMFVFHSDNLHFPYPRHSVWVGENYFLNFQTSFIEIKTKNKTNSAKKTIELISDTASGIFPKIASMVYHAICPPSKNGIGNKLNMPTPILKEARTNKKCVGLNAAL